MYPTKRITLQPAQINFLKRMYHSAARKRDKEVYIRMREEFRNRLEGDGKPMWLTQDQIASWISRYHSKIKKKARDGASAALEAEAGPEAPTYVASGPEIFLEGDNEDDDDGDEGADGTGSE